MCYLMCYPVSDPISYQSNAIRAQPQAAEGFVTLSLSMLLLSILALTSLYAAQFKLQEQRILANHQRVQLAGLIARAALTKAAFQLIIRRDPEQLPATGILTGGRYEITWQHSGPVVQLTAMGFAPGGGDTDDETTGGTAGNTTVRQQASVQMLLTPLLKQQPQQPVLVRDGFTTNGTAVLEQWPQDGLPYEKVVSTGLLSDLLVKPPGVKSTGSPAGHLRELKALADLQTTNCLDISATTVGFIWVNGNCRLAPQQELGQPDHPIILVVEDGQLELGYQAKIYGLIVSLAQQPGVLVSDSGTIYGALWANHGLQLLGSKLTVTLPYSIQYWLMQHLALKRSLIIPGSWHYGPL